jgi:hypothetical protein
MITQLTADWKSNLKRADKEASAMTRDAAEVAEAFAQQAYNAVGNRDREIMRDPYMLGFEVIETNDDNSRMLGCYAFRVSNEILLVPVFFLNGQVKGHQLMYRKGVKRFHPNTEKWVAYLLSLEEDETGRSVRKGVREGRLHLPLQHFGDKYASNIPHEIASFMEANGIAFDEDRHEAILKEAAEIEKEAKGGLAKVWNSLNLPGKIFVPGALAAPPATYALGRIHGQGKALDAELAGREAVKADAQKELDSSKLEAEKGGLLDSAAKTWDKAKSNPYTTLALALGIPATAIGAMLLAENGRKKKKQDDGNAESDKAAAASGNPNGELIRILFKQAMEEWESTPPEHLFADFLVDSEMGKEAAELAERLPEFAEWIELSGALNHVKKATPVATPLITLYTDAPPSGSSEEQVSEFFKRGYTLTDDRKEGEHRVRMQDPNSYRYSLSRPGCHEALGWDGTVKVVIAETCHCDGDPGANTRRDLLVLQLDGNTVKSETRIHRSDSSVRNRENIVKGVPLSAKEDCECDMPKSATPAVGASYHIWTKGGFLTSCPVKISSIRPLDAGKALRTECGMDIVIREDLEQTSKSDGMLVLGNDAVMLRAADKLQPHSWIEAGDIERVLLADRKKVKVARHNGLATLSIDDKVVARDVPPSKLAAHLACRVGLSAQEAMAAASETEKIAEFLCFHPESLSKGASVYFDRDIDFDAEFDDEDYDDDFMIRRQPIAQDARIVARRHQRPTPERHWLDAKGNNSRARNITHIPDEILLKLTDPGRQMAHLGQELGMGTLIDHGALSALTKVFDAGPFIIKYVEQLENSLDFMGRLIFMLLWKPKDFSKMFGDDDLASLENKLLGVFDASGDLVLELLQSTGDKGNL